MHNSGETNPPSHSTQSIEEDFHVEQNGQNQERGK